jgi:ribosomal protein S18 acetylase RimI-like enzyme
MSEFTLREVTGDDEAGLEAAAELFTEYAEWLAPFVTHSTIAEELESLPRPFVAPAGRLVIASAPDGRACGCIGVKRHQGEACELKRLYVRPECRGSGLGRELMSAALDAACEMGYSAALVSSIPAHMPEAVGMYESLGFTRTHRFEDHTHAEVEMVYLRLELGDWCA